MVAGVGYFHQSMCLFCPDTAIDPLDPHAVTCRHGGDVVTCHNRLRDEVFDLCRHAHLSVSVERGHGLTRDLPHTRPADTLIAGWDGVFFERFTWSVKATLEQSSP